MRRGREVLQIVKGTRRNTVLNRSVNYQEQSTYFAEAKYRRPGDPVLAAYAVPKLNFIERVVTLMNSSVLDVGCGNGVFTFYLRDRCRSVAGVDFSANMLAENPCRTLTQADVTALPFASESFDVTFEANVLHHVNCPGQVLKEMVRTSRRWVVLIEPNRNNPLMFLFGMMIKAERASLQSHPGYLRRLLQENGLMVRLSMSTGMISQNNTPSALIPLLRCFDRDFPLGEYLIAVGEKPSHQMSDGTRSRNC